MWLKFYLMLNFSQNYSMGGHGNDIATINEYCYNNNINDNK